MAEHGCGTFGLFGEENCSGWQQSVGHCCCCFVVARRKEATWFGCRRKRLKVKVKGIRK